MCRLVLKHSTLCWMLRTKDFKHKALTTERKIMFPFLLFNSATQATIGLGCEVEVCCEMAAEPPPPC